MHPQSIEYKFAHYTHKKHLWISLFMLFSGLVVFASFLLVLSNERPEKLFFFICLFAFIISVINLVRYEPKCFFNLLGRPGSADEVSRDRKAIRQ